MKYIGNGSAIVGIPARDLTPAEVELYGEAFLLASGLYVKNQPRKGKQESDK